MICEALTALWYTNIPHAFRSPFDEDAYTGIAELPDHTRGSEQCMPGTPGQNNFLGNLHTCTAELSNEFKVPQDTEFQSRLLNMISIDEGEAEAEIV